jgi:hypothetical protein
MKKTLFILLAAMSALLTGCLVTSVYPFYTAKDIAFDGALLGDWHKVAGENEPREQWKFEQEGTNGYRLAYTEGTNSSTVQAHLFKLKTETFLDLFNPAQVEVQPPPIPAHFLLRVFQLKPTVRMAALDYDWLDKLLTSQPAALRHTVIPADTSTSDTRVVLTADTAELQTFILKHLKTGEAWTNAFELKRDGQ